MEVSVPCWDQKSVEDWHGIVCKSSLRSLGCSNHSLQSYNNMASSNSTFKTLPFDLCLAAQEILFHYLFVAQKETYKKSENERQLLELVNSNLCMEHLLFIGHFFLGIGDRILYHCSMKLIFQLWVGSCEERYSAVKTIRKYDDF